MGTILVTGAAGFIGHWTTLELLEKGHRVIGVDDFNPYYEPTLKRARASRLKDRCQIHEVDISHYKPLEAIFQENRIDQICHLAAQAGVRYSLTHPFVYEQSNNLGTLNLLELARHHRVPSFIFASSSSVYGGNKKIPFSEQDPVDQPISLYAATKKSNELVAHTYHHLYGLHCTGLRFFTVYGPWGRPDMALFKFTKAILEGRPIDVYNHGQMKRDFTYISDIVQGVLSALEKNHPYEIFNLGHSEPVGLLDFIGTLEKELGREAQKNFLPMEPGDVPETYADIDKARRLLGFSPSMPLADGIRAFTEWYKEYYR